MTVNAPPGPSATALVLRNVGGPGRDGNGNHPGRQLRRAGACCGDPAFRLHQHQPGRERPDRHAPVAAGRTANPQLYVTASDNPGSYTFSGVLASEDKSETTVGGSSSVTVRVAAPEPEPEPQGNRAPVFPGSSTTRSIDENSASGANVGAAVRATDADGDTLTYSLTGTDAGSFTINSSTAR